jgi:predicted PurR-regulated permease PerM
VRSKLTEVLTQGSSLIATQTLSVGQDAFSLRVSLLLTVYLAFFLVRDGAGIVRAVLQAVPLAEGHKQALVAKFGTVLRATVRGNLVIALIQGVLGGLALYTLGVDGALLWAVLMAVLSLLPAVGSSLVWGPLALWLFLTGETGSAVALIAWGVLAIGLVDNLLRPLLVGRDTGMPDYLVLISTLGRHCGARFERLRCRPDGCGDVHGGVAHPGHAMKPGTVNGTSPLRCCLDCVLPPRTRFRSGRPG